MPLDDDMLFRDGSTADLTPTETIAVLTTLNASGARVLDIRSTGAKGMVAVMNCPAAPTQFADTLTALVQASDYYSAGWKTVASWPVLYALNRRLTVTCTTAYVAGDIGQTVTGGDTTDQGVIRWIDPRLEVIGGTGDLVVSQVAANSDFDDADEAITGGTGVSAMTRVSSLTEYLSYGVYPLRFRTSKRYVRVSLTVTTGGNWGATLIGLANAWNFPKADM